MNFNSNIHKYSTADFSQIIKLNYLKYIKQKSSK